MSSMLFFTSPIYVKELKLGKFFTLEELCERAGVPCLASGAWTGRRVEIRHGNLMVIECEPGDWGKVRVTMKKSSKRDEARRTLLVLAYALHDLVAKQSVVGFSWAKIPLPRGRIRTGKALSNAERQRLFRERIGGI